MKYQEFKHLKRTQVDKLREIFGENGQFAEYLSQPNAVYAFTRDLKTALTYDREYSLADLVHHHNRIPLDEVDEVERFAKERLDYLLNKGEINNNRRNQYGLLVLSALNHIRQMAETHVTIGDFMKNALENEEKQAKRILHRLFGGAEVTSSS